MSSNSSVRDSSAGQHAEEDENIPTQSSSVTPGRQSIASTAATPAQKQDSGLGETSDQQEGYSRKRTASISLESKDNKKHKLKTACEPILGDCGTEQHVVSRAEHETLRTKALETFTAQKRTIKALQANQDRLEVQLDNKTDEVATLQEQLQCKTDEAQSINHDLVRSREQALTLAARVQQLKDNDEDFRAAFLRKWTPVHNREMEAKHTKELDAKQAKVDKAVKDLKEAKANHRARLKEFKAECDAKVKDVTPEHSHLLRGKDAELKRKDIAIERLNGRIEVLLTNVRKFISEKSQAQKERKEAEDALQVKLDELSKLKAKLKRSLEGGQQELLEMIAKKDKYKTMFTDLEAKAKEKQASLKNEIQVEKRRAGQQYEIAQTNARQRVQIQRDLTMMQNAHERSLQTNASLRIELDKIEASMARLSSPTASVGISRDASAPNNFVAENDPQGANDMTSPEMKGEHEVKTDSVNLCPGTDPLAGLKSKDNRLEGKGMLAFANDLRGICESSKSNDCPDDCAEAATRDQASNDVARSIDSNHCFSGFAEDPPGQETLDAFADSVLQIEDLQEHGCRTRITPIEATVVSSASSALKDVQDGNFETAVDSPKVFDAADDGTKATQQAEQNDLSGGTLSNAPAAGPPTKILGMDLTEVSRDA